MYFILLLFLKLQLQITKFWKVSVSSVNICAVVFFFAYVLKPVFLISKFMRIRITLEETYYYLDFFLKEKEYGICTDFFVKPKFKHIFPCILCVSGLFYFL